ncbi:hypothetical protein BKA93DRAFT_752148 [Sparassis latifolia]
MSESGCGQFANVRFDTWRKPARSAKPPDRSDDAPRTLPSGLSMEIPSPPEEINVSREQMGIECSSTNALSTSPNAVAFPLDIPVIAVMTLHRDLSWTDPHGTLVCTPQSTAFGASMKTSSAAAIANLPMHPQAQAKAMFRLMKLKWLNAVLVLLRWILMLREETRMARPTVKLTDIDAGAPANQCRRPDNNRVVHAGDSNTHTEGPTQALMQGSEVFGEDRHTLSLYVREEASM